MMKKKQKKNMKMQVILLGLFRYWFYDKLKRRKETKKNKKERKKKINLHSVTGIQS